MHDMYNSVYSVTFSQCGLTVNNKRSDHIVSVGTALHRSHTVDKMYFGFSCHRTNTAVVDLLHGAFAAKVRKKSNTAATKVVQNAHGVKQLHVRYLVERPSSWVMVVQGGRDVGVAIAGGVVDGHRKLQLQPTGKKIKEAAVAWNQNTVAA